MVVFILFFLLLIRLFVFFGGIGDGGDLMQHEETIDDLSRPAAAPTRLEDSSYCGLTKLLQFLVLDYAAEGEHDLCAAVEGGGKGLEGFYHLVEDLHYIDYF